MRWGTTIWIELSTPKQPSKHLSGFYIFKCFEKILTHSILVSFPAAVIKYSNKVNYGENVSMAHSSSSEPTRKGKSPQELPGAGHNQIKKQRPVGENAHASVQITFCALCSPGSLAWEIRIGLLMSADINKIANNSMLRDPSPGWFFILNLQ